jgi:hypothetical protein
VRKVIKKDEIIDEQPRQSSKYITPTPLQQQVVEIIQS